MSKTRPLVLILGSLLLTACSIFISETDEDVLQVAQQLLEEQKDQYGEPKKIALPVRVNYAIHQKPVIKQELEIEFEFLPESNIAVLRLGLTASDGLEIVDGDIGEKYSDLEARQVFKKYVTVIPGEENEFYLNLFVVTEQGEDRRARLVKVPIALGEFSRHKKSRP